MKGLLKMVFLFLVGGGIYYGLEILFRGHSNTIMIVVGGLCFLMCGWLNEDMWWEMPLPWQMLLGAIGITMVEFLSGSVFNIILGLNLWDYSNMPFNLFGQICLPFFFLWYLLAGVAIVVDDYLRYWIFGEEKPHYTFWSWGS